jgi:hypothetical protein
LYVWVRFHLLAHASTLCVCAIVLAPLFGCFLHFFKNLLLCILLIVFLNVFFFQMGFDKRPERLPYYLSGEDPILFDLWPELASFRDVVYLFKAMMCPSSASLPELKPWHPSKARLRWRVAKDGGGGAVFEVSGFDQKTLKCNAFVASAVPGKAPAGSAAAAGAEAGGREAAPSPRGAADVSGGDGGGDGDGDGAAAGKKKGWGTGFLSALGFGVEKPRAPPSGADPSVLCGTAIATEDDVLHVRYLPGQ